MANKKLTNENKESLLDVWVNNENKRDNIYFFSRQDTNETEIRYLAFSKGLIIKIEPLDEYYGKVTFIEILT